MRRALRFGLVLAVCGVATGCRVGHNPVASPAARSPHGVLVELRLRSGDDSLSGELIEVRDQAIVVRAIGQIVLVPFSAVRSARSQSGPRRTRVRGSDAEHFKTWAPFARYPYGLTEAQLDELLRLEGQSTLVVVGS